LERINLERITKLKITIQLIHINYNNKLE